jgi:sigma-B regulation protein RsbQ
MGVAAHRNNVRESGLPTGRPILFSHGYGCDSTMWRYVAPMFEATHRVLTFDHVGFGGSDRTQWDAGRYSSLDAYADDLLELLAELDLTDVVFVGHSVSSMIGVLAANREPSRFGALVLVGPSPRYIDDQTAGYVGGFSAADIAELVATVDTNHLSWSVGMAPVIMGNPDRPELSAELAASFCRVEPQVASAFVRATFLSDNRDDLARVTCPTLILQCSNDVIAPEAVGRFVHAQIRGSELVLLGAEGHCPNLSSPAETGAAILAYLERHAR